MSSSIDSANLKVLCDLTHSLIVLRMRECPHLCVENLAPEIFGKLLTLYLNGGHLIMGGPSE